MEWQDKVRKTKDIVGIPCIHDKDGNIKVSLENKMEVWKEYEVLLNKENEWRGELNVEKNEGPSKKVSVTKSSCGSLKFHKSKKIGWTKV